MIKRFWQNHKIWSAFILFVLLILLVLVVGGVWLRGRIEDSLPVLEGEISCAGLRAKVTIDRDELSVPVVNAKTVEDAFFAEGFLHAQERYFQMDLCRRFAAGELAELFGERAVGFDFSQRPLGARHHAQAMVAALDPRARGQFESYVEGVHAGLNNLGDVPPEYLLLQCDPEPWTIEDSMLIAFFFFDALSYNEIYEKNLGPMHELLPPSLYEFLTPDLTSFDQPLTAESTIQSVPIPPPGVINLRDGKERKKVERDVVQTFDNMGIGSNNWAVAAAKSATNQAILANDPHLRGSIPGAWYRLQLKWGDQVVTGLSAPGAPGILIGENGHIAWGFTNGMADHEDLIIVEEVPQKEGYYKTPQGEKKFEVEEQEISWGDNSETIEVRSTIWGTVVGKDWLERPLVLKSTSSNPAQHNLKLLEIMTATTLDQGIEAAAKWYGPSQNVLIADQQGRIGWVLSGYLPKRVGFDGKAPAKWAAGDCFWQGQVERPMMKDPQSGFLFTANNRLLRPKASRAISRVWVPAWRARRIHALLSRDEKFTLGDMAKMQLDTRDEQYDRIQRLIQSEIDVQRSASVARAARMVKSWDGHANLDSIGLHILKIFTERLREAVFAPLLAECAMADKTFYYNWPLKDQPLFQLLEEKPIHLLSPEYADWTQMINQVFQEVAEDIEKDSQFGLETTWGGVRIAYYDHPLGGAPVFGSLLNMPSRGLPGDANTVRAQGPRFGASMRLVVSPGEAAKGLFQMPGGQSGHFESEHYGDQHQDWVDGTSKHFAPGKSRHHLVLKPN